MTTPASTRFHLSLVLVPFVLLTQVTPVAAQPREPVGPFVADVRIGLPGFKDDATVASAIGVATADMPGRGLGLALGAHWYPVGNSRVALGVGGEILASGASRQPEPPESGAPVADPVGVRTRFWTVSPQVSLNFGSSRGWSYLSGGIGWGGYRTEREDAPVADGVSRPRVLNYGGGARWFAREHLAFAIDLRFYSLSSQEATTGRPAYPSVTLMVFSAGVAFK